MILDNDTQNKLRALHYVIVRARTQAYLGMDNKKLARLLDDAEYLTTRIFAPDPDEPGEFRALLHEMETKHEGLQGVNKAYNEMEARRLEDAALLIK